MEINIKNCRGQSYDNAANMSGRYKGLQARIREHTEAFYVPCAAHSLNLVLNAAAESCRDSTTFFDLVQKLYTFFSASTARWNILEQAFSEKKKSFTLKRLSDTRWSARADATAALMRGYAEIITALRRVGSDKSQKPITMIEANALANNMEKWDTAMLTAMWNRFLNRFNLTSKSLQNPSISLGNSVELYQSLQKFVQQIRDEGFKDIEKEAASLDCLVTTTEYEFKVNRNRKQKRFFDELGIEFTEHGNGRRRFIVETFYPVCDTLLAETKKKTEGYQELNGHFRVLFDCHGMSLSEIRNAATKLRSVYKNDLDEGFEEELLHYLQFALGKDIKSPIEMYKYLKESALESTFPNVCILLSVYLTLPSTNASGERSFSALKGVKITFATQWERLG